MSVYVLEVKDFISMLMDFDVWMKKINNLEKDDRLCFNLSGVKFINTEALIVLVTASKLAYDKSLKNVLWDQLKPEVYSYLERVDVTRIRFISIKRPASAKKFNRAVTQSNNLVELSIIGNWKDIGDAIKKTKGVLNRWFPNKSADYHRKVITLIKETVENSIDHSGEHPNEGFCYYAVQKYEHSDGKVEIFIAVGDIGVGMLASLRRVYPDTKDDAAAIVGALIDGKSGRESGRGGLGYVTIKETLADLKGQLTIRSGKAAVKYSSLRCVPQVYRKKTFYPGTQIIFRCRG